MAPQLERNCTRGLWPDISHSRGFESLCEKRRLEREKERLPGTALVGAPPGHVSPWRPRSAPVPERQLSQPRVQRGQELPDTHMEDRDAAKPPMGVLPRLTPQQGLSKLHGTGRDLAHGAQVPQVRRETQASPQGAGRLPEDHGYRSIWPRAVRDSKIKGIPAFDRYSSNTEIQGPTEH